ncbi:MAG TPA: type IV pilus secretin PilQ [Burkholderiaceae bacterium]|nr:type IV pilus secretin PilQ [Burkholderiaceae bacterium]
MIFSKLRSVCAVLCASGVALLLVGSALGQDATGTAGGNSIERIDATQTGAGVFLTIELKTAAGSVPNSFSVTNPARVALDLPGTVNNLGRNAIEINQGDLRSVNVVQAQGRARIVLNLRRPVTYTVSLKGNSVQVALGTGAEGPTFPAQPAASATTAAETPKAAPAMAATAAPVPAPTPEPHSIRALDFRRGAEGEGRVVVDLSDPNTSVDVHQQGQTLVVDFTATTLPEPLRKRLDVTDFGTPVAMVTGSQVGANAHLVIEPRGQWEQNAYQSDNRFVVEVKPIKEDPTRLFQGTRKGYQGERLSLNFQNVDVRSLLQVIADFTNLNIITSDSVQGSITLRLKDVPWDQALDIILQSKGLDMRKNGNVIVVAPRDELATKEKLDLEARTQISDLEPLHTENFVINYQKADDIKKLLTGDPKQTLLSKRGSVVVDVRTNQMFVRETASRLEEIRRLIARIDIPVPQVMIEARIVEAEDSFSSDIGSRFGALHVSSHSWVNGGAGSAYSSSSSTTTGTNTTTINGVTITNPNFVNLPAAAINGYNPGTFGLTLFNSAVTNMLNLEITALELDGRGKVISSPRVVTADKVKAHIEQGQEIPYQSVSAGGGIGQVQFRKAVLSLEVTPQITPEGAIFLDVKVNKDTPSATVSGSGGIAIDTKNVATQVLVENGGTVVLGGIYQQTIQETITRVPILGEIPFIGVLFRDVAKTNDRTELLIFITPRILSERVINQAAQ